MAPLLSSFLSLSILFSVLFSNHIFLLGNALSPSQTSTLTSNNNNDIDNDNTNPLVRRRAASGTSYHQQQSKKTNSTTRKTLVYSDDVIVPDKLDSACPSGFDIVRKILSKFVPHLFKRSSDRSMTYFSSIMHGDAVNNNHYHPSETISLWKSGEVKYIEYDPVLFAQIPQLSCLVETLKSQNLEKIDASGLSAFTNATQFISEATSQAVRFSKIKKVEELIRHITYEGQVLFLASAKLRHNLMGQSLLGVKQFDKIRFGYFALTKPEDRKDLTVHELFTVALHELGHVLGLDHEFQRPDRDQYLAGVDAIKFPIRPDSGHTLKYKGGMDFQSFMNYNLDALGPNVYYLPHPRFTIFLKKFNKTYDEYRAQSFEIITKLSPCDIHTLRMLYSTNVNGEVLSSIECY